MEKVSVREIQGPLRTQYKSSPEAARVIDHARTTSADATDPFHSTVEPMPGCGATLPVGRAPRYRWHARRPHTW